MQPISCGAMVPELQCNPPEVLKGEVLKGEVLEKRLLLLFQQLLSFRMAAKSVMMKNAAGISTRPAKSRATFGRYIWQILADGRSCHLAYCNLDLAGSRSQLCKPL